MIFAAGAVVGALGMRYYLLKQSEEIEVENYVPKEEAQSDNIVEPATDNYESQKTKSIVEYAAKLSEHGYTDYAAISGGAKTEEKEEAVTEDYGQHVISDDEYGKKDGYDLYSYEYYSGNAVLVDDHQDVVLEDEIVRTVGWDALARFDNPAIWAVYVRNDKLKADYEITLDKRSFEPPHMEVDSDEDGD